MAKNSDRPRDFDAVLGGQTPPPVGGVVLGGMEGLRRRFAASIVEERVAALSDALNYGDAGIDLLVEAMNEREIIVRVTAYKLLQNVSAAKAKKAIARGIPLNIGDRIYSVYKSDISYGDDWYYITDSINQYYQKEYPLYKPGIDRSDKNLYYITNPEDGMFKYYDDCEPKLISRHLFKESAEAEAVLFHAVRMLEVNISDIWRDYPNPIENFNINEWCAANNVPLTCQDDEEEFQFETRVLQTLQNEKNLELLGQLWELIGFNRRLAFVHEDIINKKAYLQPQGNL
ncbi:hypothetical protein H6S82_11140 [Planktothrix sp. FACHB-1355]|uniref:Uncharacterized protein n=1 Tax=Aerosakkonema funiforme FACHB-1375 TaxID=2949571 RepID=A0A926VHP8_9CYAN|nr:MULTISPECIES: hypothetical protein [Oscillatoriales]MBD2183992.1 hypothetical protein [Aerosakkonema funiforme FACHB-1375]MBD3559415.1 hypothetical protein [Planktothrix sp. FACHB-1355]